MLAAPSEGVVLRWRGGVSDKSHRGSAFAAHEPAILIGSAGLRMGGSEVLHLQRDENERKCASVAHAAILSAAC